MSAIASPGTARGAIAAARLVGLAAVPVALAVAIARFAHGPEIVLVPLAVIAVAVMLLRGARAYGSEGMWIAAIAASILAGELSAVSFGGQNGRLLWADAVTMAGLAGLVYVHRLALDVPRPSFLTALVPFVAWCSIGLLPAHDPLTGIAELKEWIVAMIVGAVAARYARDARRATVLLQIVAVVGFMISVLMIWTAFHSPYGPVLAVLLKKVDLPWGRTNYLAGLLILALPIGLGLLGAAASWSRRLAWLVILLGTATGLVLSASKGAIVALVVALAVAFARAGRASRIAGLIMAAVIGIAVAVFAVGPLHQVIQYRLQATALDYSVSQRMDLYRLAIDQSVRHPLLGLGLNNFSVVANRLTGVDTVPHNFVLGFLSETGIVGLVLVTAWLAGLLASAWRARTRARTNAERSIGLGLWTAFVALAIHNQFESTIYGQQFKIFVMLAAAATWRLGEIWNAPAGPSGEASDRANCTVGGGAAVRT